MSKQTDLINVTDAITVDGSNVGIGTSSPTGALHVSRSGLEAGITLERTTSATAKFTMAANDGKLVVTDQNQSETRMVIDSSGNVGIGTSSPSEPLDVAGGKIRIGNTKIGHSGSGGSWDMAFETYSGGYFERMRIDSGGRVTMPYQPGFMAVGAIGTEFPNQKVQYNSVKWSRGNHYNASRFTAPVAGVYVIHFGIRSVNATNAHMYAQMRVNNGQIGSVIEVQPSMATEHHQSVNLVYLNVNDYVEIHSSGVNVWTDGADSFGAYLLG